MQLTLLHSEAFPISRYADALNRESIAAQSIASLEHIGVDGGMLRVVLVDPLIRGNGRALVFDSKTAIVGIGLSEQPPWLGQDSVYLHLPEDPAPSVLLSGIRRAYQFLFQKMRADQLERQLGDRTRELREVSEVGIALSAERDHAALLTKILSKARELSRADAGSLYLLEETDEGNVLRWKLAQNDSIDVDFEEKILPITRNSLAGFVAMTGETLVIDDAYNLPPDSEYSINRSFDENNNYLTKSLLVFPMANHVGDTIGVLQLINRKRPDARMKLTAATVPNAVVPFDQETVEIMRSLANQAAVAVENNLLYESIERLFEGFVTAAVTAIEQRDPTTSGHSFRVADLTVELARVIDKADFGKYQHVRFSIDQIREIRYASLLHDFGKVGVREQVLIKEKKLYPSQLETIRARFDFVMKSVENEGNKRKVDYLMRHGANGFEEFSRTCDAEVRAEIERLQHDFAFVAQSNEPTVLPEGEFRYLQQLAKRAYDDARGDKQLLLTGEEAKILSIRKGNLNASERREIESHVTHTFKFLQKIPWTKDLMQVPDIAYAHHEKLNGRGYPRKLNAEKIPLQSRMMTISDIYDALTANDRPYKRAVSTDRALDILRMEVNDGLLDSSLVDLFVDAKVYTRAGVVRT